MRVIAGTAKGLHLRSVPGDSTRPITDLVKESLFNILGDEILNVHLLDLFGGTGAVGIEALSRGAASVIFVDKSRQATRVMEENLLATGLFENAKVIKADSFSYLSTNINEIFDLIYIAPPQYRQLWQKAMQMLDERPSLLSENGQIIVQINPIEWSEMEYQHFNVFDSRRYGDTLIVFFEKKLKFHN